MLIFFSAGPSTCPFSPYATTNSVLMGNPWKGIQKDKDPKKRSGYYNHLEFNSVKLDEKEKKETFTSSSKASFTEENGIAGVLNASHHLLLNSKEPFRAETKRTGFGSNSSGFIPDNYSTDHTTSAQEHYQKREVVPSYEIPEKSKRDPLCGYVRNERPLFKSNLPLEHETTYGETIGKVEKMKIDPIAPRDRLATEKTARKKAYIAAAIPVSERTKKDKEDLEKYNKHRLKTMNPIILKRIKQKDPLEYDDIVNQRKPFDTTYGTLYDEKDIFARNMDGKKTVTGYAAAKKTIVIERFGEDEKPQSTYETQFRLRSESEGTTKKVQQKRFGFSAYQNQVSRGEYFKSKEFLNLSDTMVYDQKKLSSFHPTIAKMLKRRHPSTYGSAVPTYQHKRRDLKKDGE